MAFENTNTKRAALELAGNTQGQIRTVHSIAKSLAAQLATYQAGTDPTLNQAFNALYTAPERAVLAEVIQELSGLAITDWEANHADLLA